MLNLNFENCKSRQDIITTVERALAHVNLVANGSAALLYFRRAGFVGVMKTRVILGFLVSVWDENHNGWEDLRVEIFEHFVDAGSDDYCYSYVIY